MEISKAKQKPGVKTPSKRRLKRTPDAEATKHQGRFDQLLDDAIFGVKKK